MWRLILALGGCLLAFGTRAETAFDQIQPNGPNIYIEDFLQVPASSNVRPLARLSQMKPIGDGSRRVAVNDLYGKLYLIDRKQASPQAVLYLDLAVEIGPAFMKEPGLNSGFSGFIFHPDFAKNGKFYTAHTERPGSAVADFPLINSKRNDQQGVVLEWTAKDPKAARFVGTRRELMRVDAVQSIHGFQDLAFNPNAKPGSAEWGKLYVTLGDTGTVNAKLPENTQRLDSPLGSILRIDPLGSNSVNRQYGIPADNPYAKGQPAGTVREVWARGFRNPHRLFWDKPKPFGTGHLFAVDIGERNWEEINIIEPGRNYGWRQREGTSRINSAPDGDHAAILPLPEDDASQGYTYPVAQYSHLQGNAIAGGYVYRRQDNPALFGLIIFGDILTGRLFTVPADKLSLGKQEPISEPTLYYQGQATSMPRIIGDPQRRDIRLGHDDEDNLYILEKRYGKIYKIVPPPAQEKK